MTDAQEEANLRFPIGGFGSASQVAFVSGASWLSERILTDTAVIAAMEAYTKYRESDGPGDAIRAALCAALEVAEVRAGVVAEEPDWEYAVRHIAVDGWLTVEIHESRDAAERDYSTCGMNCVISRRRKAGPWVPVES